MTADVLTDTGYFAIVPEWLLDADVSGNAIKLYALLRRYADQDTKYAHPSRRTLAERMRFSRIQSVDPLLQQLVDAGAIEVFERRTDRGDQDSNGYLVKTQRPAGVVRETAPPRAADRTGGSARNRTTGSAVERTTVVRETAHKPEPPEPEPLEPETLSAAEEPVDNPVRTTATIGPSIDDLFDTVWAAWPRKVEKQAARKAFTKALVRIGGNRLEAADQLVTAMTTWSRIWLDLEHRTLDKIPHLASWLNGERWTDEAPDPAQLIPRVYPTGGKPLLPPAPIVRNRHCTHGYLPGARMPDGSIERCPHPDCETNSEARA